MPEYDALLSTLALTTWGGLGQRHQPVRHRRRTRPGRRHRLRGSAARPRRAGRTRWSSPPPASCNGVEFLADKIPGVDSAWDALHTFIRPAGRRPCSPRVPSATSARRWRSPPDWSAAAVSAASHAAKAGSRVLINTSPEPFSNFTASVTEDAAVFGGIWLAWQQPLMFLFAFAAFVALLFWLLPRVWRGVRGMLRRVAGWLGNAAGQLMPTTLGRLLVWGVTLALAAAAVIGGYLFHLDRTITGTFEGRRWSIPAQVFAQPLSLYPGSALTRAELRRELLRLGLRRHGGRGTSRHLFRNVAGVATGLAHRPPAVVPVSRRHSTVPAGALHLRRARHSIHHPRRRHGAAAAAPGTGRHRQLFREPRRRPGDSGAGPGADAGAGRPESHRRPQFR